MKAVLMSPKNRNSILEAVKTLKNGGVIIYPTESSYGIGADATNAEAVKRVIEIKGREDKPISIIVSSIGMAKKYAYVSREAAVLVQKFMPGRLTLVVKKKDLPDALSKETIGFRIPPHAFSLALLKKFGKPITATSANKSGKPALYRMSEVVRTFGDSVDLIIDGDNLPKRRPSTVFDVGNRKILRRGPITEKDVIKAIKA